MRLGGSYVGDRGGGMLALISIDKVRLWNNTKGGGRWCHGVVGCRRRLPSSPLPILFGVVITKY